MCLQPLPKLREVFLVDAQDCALLRAPSLQHMTSMPCTCTQAYAERRGYPCNAGYAHHDWPTSFPALDWRARDKGHSSSSRGSIRFNINVHVVARSGWTKSNSDCCKLATNIWLLTVTAYVMLASECPPDVSICYTSRVEHTMMPHLQPPYLPLDDT